EVLGQRQFRSRVASVGARALDQEGNAARRMCSPVRAAQHEPGERLHRQLGRQVLLQILAARHRDSQWRPGWQRLPYEPAELEAVLRAVPYYRRTVMRVGAIRSLEADLPQVAVVNVLVTHRRVADAIVQEAVTAIATGCGELGDLNTGMEQLFAPLRSQGPSALEFGGVPLHPGAL